MTRTPLFLAALASAAVPGLNPVGVRPAVSRPGHEFETAFVEDAEHLRWTIRAPRTEAAGARLEATATMLRLLSRRVPFAVPVPRGFVTVPQGRAMVYAHISGRLLDLAEVPGGPGLAADIGRAIAQLHNVDPALYEEAGLPAYDADTYRTRKLAELDRAAATGHVPVRLLQRWEAALEDVSLWRFVPLPVHGNVCGPQLLALFPDEQDGASGRIRALLGWEDAKVADPAEDFAAVVAQCRPETVDSVLEAYAMTCVRRPDPHLRVRAQLAAETSVLGALLRALTGGQSELAARWSADLRMLDATLADAAPIARAAAAREATESVGVAGSGGVTESVDVTEPVEVTGPITPPRAVEVGSGQPEEATQGFVPTWEDPVAGAASGLAAVPDDPTFDDTSSGDDAGDRTDVIVAAPVPPDRPPRAAHSEPESG